MCPNTNPDPRHFFIITRRQPSRFAVNVEASKSHNSLTLASCLTREELLQNADWLQLSNSKLYDSERNIESRNKVSKQVVMRLFSSAKMRYAAAAGAKPLVILIALFKLSMLVLPS